MDDGSLPCAAPRALPSLFCRQHGYDVVMAAPKQTLEYSDFSGEFIEDDVVVRIAIYRAAGSADGWTLEVIDHTGASSVWDDAFETDQAAYEEFLATVQRDGIETFLDEPVTLLH